MNAAANIIAFPGSDLAAPTLKTFRVKAWNGKREHDCTFHPFRVAPSNPDVNKFVECNASDMGTASKLWREGEVEVWGWL